MGAKIGGMMGMLIAIAADLTFADMRTYLRGFTNLPSCIREPVSIIIIYISILINTDSKRVS